MIPGGESTEYLKQTQAGQKTGRILGENWNPNSS
jgi:hypothetical protein